MLQPEIQDRIDRWTKILAGWFEATNAAAHLNHRCSADNVFYDLLACLSGLVREQEGKEQQDGLDRAGTALRLCGLPNIEMLFRDTIHGVLSRGRRIRRSPVERDFIGAIRPGGARTQHEWLFSYGKERRNAL